MKNVHQPRSQARAELNAAIAVCAGLALVGAVGCSKGGSGSGGAASTAPGSTAASSTTTAGSTTAATTSTTTPDGRVEYLQWNTSDNFAAADIITVLDETIGVGSVANTVNLQLRRGFYVSGTAQNANVIVELDSDSAGVRPLQCYCQVAVSTDMAQEFIALCQVAMSTEALTAQTPGLAAPWNLFLHAESPTGGSMDIGVAGDAQANFTLTFSSWGPSCPSLSSRRRPRSIPRALRARSRRSAARSTSRSTSRPSSSS